MFQITFFHWLNRLIPGLIITLFSLTPALSNEEKLVIAHRGASGYLPEHTIAAKAMAYGMGSHYIEQDLVMTKDDRVIVLHDHHLDQVTNVREIFPERHRYDGRYYVIDFTLDEIRKLSIRERFFIKNGKVTAVFPDRFPLNQSHFRIHTFEEEIELIQGLNKSTGRDVGIYPEIKSPAFHKNEGKDISQAVLNILYSYGYRQKSDKVFLQCFDVVELKLIHDTLQPDMKMDLKLVQLLDDEEDNSALLSQKGLSNLATYAVGIGPSMNMIISNTSDRDTLNISPLVQDAHKAGLKIHPYTFRYERNMIPPYAKDYDDLLNIFLHQVGVDGVFTDFPDKTLNFLE